MSLPKPTESKDKDLRVVAIGGGTGLSTLLRGLKRYVSSPERRRGIRLGDSAGFERAPVPPCPAPQCIIPQKAHKAMAHMQASKGSLRLSAE